MILMHVKDHLKYFSYYLQANIYDTSESNYGANKVDAERNFFP
jgi:hypothetical protein